MSARGRAATLRAERAEPNANVFDAVGGHVAALQAAGKRVVDRAVERGRARAHAPRARRARPAQSRNGARPGRRRWRCPRSDVALAVLGLETGFETGDLAVIGEQDILGDRLVRPRRAARRAENFITEATSLAAGDLVVHVDHGIGRFVGLQTIEAAGAPHDCLEIHYAGGDKLFLPVENIELLSRYGSEETERRARPARRRRLAGAQGAAEEPHPRDGGRADQDRGRAASCARRRSWPWRTAPMTNSAPASPMRKPRTSRRRSTRCSTISPAGRPMDRLICGDVGFGKTEVALRAAFVAAMDGKQVAVVVPTTLLARQHFKTFTERFRGLPVKVAQASRLVAGAELAAGQERASPTATIDIVVGTHALLGKAIEFKDLGLLIVDEEQHFGVAHKERLKELRADVHVLTLTATPIPRTLQLALTGVRELSLIATPPVDRLAVRTFVSPFDPLVVREALLRERYRGGQSFYVCPRIEDLAGRQGFPRQDTCRR